MQGYSQLQYQEAKTNNGVEVILCSDGSWKLKNPEAVNNSAKNSNDNNSSSRSEPSVNYNKSSTSNNSPQYNNNTNSNTPNNSTTSNSGISKFLGKWINNGKAQGEVFRGSTVTITSQGSNIIVLLNSSGEKLQNVGTYQNDRIRVSLSWAGETEIFFTVENGSPHIYVFGAKLDKVN